MMALSEPEEKPSPHPLSASIVVTPSMVVVMVMLMLMMNAAAHAVGAVRQVGPNRSVSMSRRLEQCIAFCVKRGHDLVVGYFEI